MARWRACCHHHMILVHHVGMFYLYTYTHSVNLKYFFACALTLFLSLSHFQLLLIPFFAPEFVCNKVQKSICDSIYGVLDRLRLHRNREIHYSFGMIHSIFWFFECLPTPHPLSAVLLFRKFGLLVENWSFSLQPTTNKCKPIWPSVHCRVTLTSINSNVSILQSYSHLIPFCIPLAHG